MLIHELKNADVARSFVSTFLVKVSGSPLVPFREGAFVPAGKSPKHTQCGGLACNGLQWPCFCDEAGVLE
jgi:hypothetical protein